MGRYTITYRKNLKLVNWSPSSRPRKTEEMSRRERFSINKDCFLIAFSKNFALIWFFLNFQITTFSLVTCFFSSRQFSRCSQRLRRLCRYPTYRREKNSQRVCKAHNRNILGVFSFVCSYPFLYFSIIWIVFYWFWNLELCFFCTK